MTIEQLDQLEEIIQWLSPLEDYSVIKYKLKATGIDKAECRIEKYHGERICDLYFSVEDGKMNVENPSESHTALAYTSVWEQICLR